MYVLVLEYRLCKRVAFHKLKEKTGTHARIRYRSCMLVEFQVLIKSHVFKEQRCILTCCVKTCVE